MFKSLQLSKAFWITISIVYSYCLFVLYVFLISPGDLFNLDIAHNIFCYEAHCCSFGGYSFWINCVSGNSKQVLKICQVRNSGINCMGFHHVH